MATPAAAAEISRHVRGRAEAVALGAALAALVAAAVYRGGGSSAVELAPLGTAVLVVAAVAGAGVLAGRLPAPAVGRSGLVCISALGLLTAWSGLSILWSIAPDLSWGALNRGVVYLGFLFLGCLLGAAVRRAPSLAAQAFAVIVAVALAWALVAKVVPSLDDDGGRIARLRLPVDFWNALAMLLLLALPIALWLAADPGRRHAVRVASVVLVYGLVVGLLLTYSRGGLAVGALVLAAWLVLAERRLETVVALAIALPVAGGVFAWALQLHGVVDDGQTEAARAADGRTFGFVLLGGALIVAALALAWSLLEARHPADERTRALLGRWARLAALVLVAAGIVVAGVRAEAVGAWFERQADAFANPPTELVTQEPERLTSLSSNNRWTWWNEAWQAFQASPLEGTGAGSFATVHRILREDALTVTEPHSVPLQFLAGTGAIGAALAIAAAVAALVGAAGAVRRVPRGERGAALALAIGIGAYCLHSLVDFDWNFVAVTAPVLVATGVLVAASRPAARRRDLRPLPALALLAAAGIASLALPWLSERRVDTAYAELGQGRAERALADADAAASLNPLSLAPLVARAAAQTALGDLAGARAALVEAVELQPLDAGAWYELGAFEHGPGGDPVAAERYLRRAQELDPFGPANELLETVAPG